MENASLYDGFVTVEKAPNGHEVVRATDSAAFLIYLTDTDEIILISQPRMPMVRQDNPRGLITEVPAGRFDVALGVKALMVKEAWEEVGLRLSESDIILINEGVPLACSPGVLTERIYLAYAYGRASELQPREEVHFTAEGEEIRQVRVSADNLSLRALACEDLKTFALIQWFLAYQT